MTGIPTRMVKKAPFLLLCLLLLAACRPARPTAVTSLTVEFREDAFSLSAQRVMAGATLALTILNPTPSEHRLMLLSEPLSKGMDTLDSRQNIFEMKISAGQTVTGSFQLPPAPGEYWLICAEPGHLEKGESGKIVLVHPDYAR